MVKKLTKYCIAGLFIDDYNRKYYLRELASLLKKPHQSIKPYVEELVKGGVLVKTKRGNIVEYGLNFNNRQIYDFLVIAEKERLGTRLNEDSLMNVLFDKLSDYFMNNTFVIFGSSVEKIRKGSDIDLLIVGKLNVNFILNEIEEVYNRKIHKVQIDRIEKLNSPLIKEIYKKHLILNNTEYIVTFFGGLYEKNKLV